LQFIPERSQLNIVRESNAGQMMLIEHLGQFLALGCPLTLQIITLCV